MTESSLHQYQIDQIVMAIRQELNSPSATNRFDTLLDKYYKSNTDLSGKIELFHKAIVNNQEQITSLLKQIIDNSSIECPNNPDLEILRRWMEELLVGDEYKLKQQVRDLLESGFARKLRNIVVTYITITAIMAILTGAIGYFAMTKAISTEIKIIKIYNIKGVPNGNVVDPER